MNVKGVSWSRVVAGGLSQVITADCAGGEAVRGDVGPVVLLGLWSWTVSRIAGRNIIVSSRRWRGLFVGPRRCDVDCRWFSCKWGVGKGGCMWGRKWCLL